MTISLWRSRSGFCTESTHCVFVHTSLQTLRNTAKRKDAAYHTSRPCPENRKGRVHHSARCCGGQRSETHSIGCALVLVACVPMPACREISPPGFTFPAPAASIPRSLRIFRAPCRRLACLAESRP